MLRNHVDDAESQRHHESEANRQELTGQKKLYERELEKLRQSQSGEKSTHAISEENVLKH